MKTCYLKFTPFLQTRIDFLKNTITNKDIMNNTQKFAVSISKVAYANKNKIPYDRMEFEKKEITIDELVNSIQQGYSFMAELKEYGRTTRKDKKGKDKTIQWRGAEDIKHTNFIGVDIDDSELGFSDYISTISSDIQPTFAYTTFNDGLEGYGHRYRLIYVTNEQIEKQDEFEKYYNGIVNLLNDCTQTENADNCGAEMSRLFNGNARKDIQVSISYKIYDLKDIPQSDYIIKKSKKKKKADHNSQVVNDFIENDIDDFMCEYLTRIYKPITKETVKYNKDGYAVLPETYKKIKDDFVSYKQVRIIGVGEGRKKWLYTRLQMIKSIKPNITFDELLFNGVWLLKYRINNADDKITKDYLLEVATNVFEGKCKIKWEKNKKQYEVSKGWCYYHHIKPNSYAKVVGKIINYQKIGEWYDTSKSARENSRYAAENNIPRASYDILRKWCIENNVPLKGTDYEPKRKANKKVMEEQTNKATNSDISSVEKQGEQTHHREQENATERTTRHISITDWFLAMKNLNGTLETIYAMAKSA